MDKPGGKTKKIKWQALEHIKVERSEDWFWIIGIIAVGGAVLAVYFSNILFALLILIGTFTIFLQAHTEPKIQKYELNRRGVVIGSQLYPYSTLESYYVIDEDGWDRDRLLLKSKKTFMPLLILPLGEDTTPEEVSEFLIEYLDEEHLEESSIEKIAILLGF
jgi:hypothetical protein